MDKGVKKTIKNSRSMDTFIKGKDTLYDNR
jgi:hypothetical protein